MGEKFTSKCHWCMLKFNGDIYASFGLVLPRLDLGRFNIQDALLLELCREYYNEHHKVPKFDDKIGIIRIGKIVSAMRCEVGNTKSDVLIELENIFELNPTDQDIIDLSKEFHSRYHRIPYENELYKSKRLGKVVHGVRCGKIQASEYLKSELEKIFGTYRIRHIQVDTDTKIKLLTEYFKKYNYMPKHKEKYGGVPLGSYLHSARKGRGDVRFINFIRDTYGCKINSDNS